MNRLLSRLTVILIFSILFSGFVNANDCGGAIQCECGDTLIESQTMWYDLEGCQYNGLLIDNDNLVLDCDNHIINGEDTIYPNGYGIHLNTTNNFTLINCNIDEFMNGVRLDSSSQNTMSNNNIHNTHQAIWLMENSNNNLISNNELNNNNYKGISLSHSSNNILTNNNLNQNGGGISLAFGQNNQVSNNHISETDTGYDIYVHAETDEECNNLIENNIGSGNREIKYFNSEINLENEILSELILCNADNSNINGVIIEGSENLKNNGIIVSRTDNSEFIGIDSSNNYLGLMLTGSSNNLISNSNFNYNEQSGISFADSNINNQIVNNNIAENERKDIYFWVYTEEECNNVIENNVGSGRRPIVYLNSQTTFEDETVSELILCNADNSIIRNVDIFGSNHLDNNGVIIQFTEGSEFINLDSSNNGYGLSLLYSSNNSFLNSSFNNNFYDGISSSYSSNNNFINNVIKNNGWGGIKLSRSSDNYVSNNFVKDNQNRGIFLVIESNNNVINDNYIYDNEIGISTSGNPDQLNTNNEFSNNRIVNSEEQGIILWWAQNNLFWSNVFINNGINAQEFGVSLNNNSWNTTEQGNYWDDFGSNIGYPNYYQIFTYSWEDDGNIDYHPNFVEFYIDNSDEEFIVLSGEWNSRHFMNAYNEEASFNNQGFGLERVAYKVNNVVIPGTYEVYVWKFENEYSNLTGTDVHYMVYHRTGTTDWILVDQSTTGNEWISLGEYEFDDSHGQGVLITDEANGYVITDSIKLVYTGPLSEVESFGKDILI